MPKFYPELSNIERLTVPPTHGERHLLSVLHDNLDESYEVYFNPYLDGDRPDLIIVKPGCNIMIIEVKDWHLDNYRVDARNKWHYQDRSLLSPQQQVFNYKKNVFDLHVPTLGLQHLRNKSFFGLISVGVYFHCASKHQLKRLYDEPLEVVRKQILELNRNYRVMEQADYDQKMDRLERSRLKLNRDFAMAWGNENVLLKIRQLEKVHENELFTSEILEDLRRRLRPPVHVEQQGVSVEFDSKQLTLTESFPLFAKIKGVAGCGKTTILAQRAINAHSRHGCQVLILTFNITLRHYIRDQISRLQGGGGRSPHFEVIHYHAFINSQLNNAGVDLDSKLAHLSPAKRADINFIYGLKSLFEDVETEKYRTILIDEVQDFHPQWVKLIRDCFLAEDGEMVLFGDQSQNIYGRPADRRESSIVQGFGSWVRLTKSYRTSGDAPLIELFRDFQLDHLLSKYQDSDVFAVSDAKASQSSMRFDLLNYEVYGEFYDPGFVLARVRRYITDYRLHPNDIALISSTVDYLVPINEGLRVSEKTKVTFEELSEIEALPPDVRANNMLRLEEVENIRRRKKSFFTQNSGLIKLSTIHSFKGLEAKTVFCILRPEDDAEMVYTGITRAQRNLVIFDVSTSKYRSFFESHMDVLR